MTQSQYLKISCDHCGNNIEYSSGAGGAEIQCPHCGEAVLLPARARGSKAWAIILTAVVGVLLAGGAAFFYFESRKSAGGFSTTGDGGTNTAAAVLSNAVQTSAAVPTASGTNVNLPASNAAPVAPKPPEKKPKSPADLSVGKIALEKTPGSRLVYAVGTLKNSSEYQHFGVRVTVEILDAHGLKIGSAQDYIGIVEPRKSWKFRALVVDPKAASAALGSIKEESQ